MTIRKQLFAGLILSSSLATGNALAVIQNNDNDVVKVSYNSNELTEASTQVALYERLSNAARDACGSPHVRVAGSLHQASDNKRCFSKALNKAIEEIGSAALTRLHQQDS